MARRPGGWAIGPKATNRTTSRACAKVEHTIGMIKQMFGFQKMCYRGVARNLYRPKVTAALMHLHLMQRRLLNVYGTCR